MVMPIAKKCHAVFSAWLLKGYDVAIFDNTLFEQLPSPPGPVSDQ
jgi:hypothetical protein